MGDPTDEIMALKRLPKLASMTADESFLALLAKSSFEQVKFSRDGQKDAKNLAQARSFVFNADEITEIMNRTHITTSEAMIATYFILYSFLGWRWSEMERKIDDMVLLLEACLYASSIASLLAPAKVFMFVFGCYLESYPELDMFEQLLGLFRSFFLQVPELPDRAFDMVPCLLGRVVHQKNAEYLRLMLITGRQIAEKRKDIISAKEAESIADGLDVLRDDMSLEMLQMYAAISEKVKAERTCDLIKSLVKKLTEMTLKARDVLVPKGSDDPPVQYGELDDSLGTTLSFEHVETFTDGFTMDLRVKLPQQVAIEDLLDVSIVPYFEVALKFVGSSTSFCQTLTEELIMAIHDNCDGHNVMALYALFLSVCKRCMKSVGRLLTVSPSLCNALLFDPTVICNGESEEMMNLNALRSAAFDVFIFEGIDTLCAVGTSYLRYPFLFAEYMRRCIAALREVQKLLTTKSPFVAFLSKAILYTQKVRFEGHEEMDDVRITIIHFFSQCLEDQSIACFFFLDAQFVQVFISLAFEEPLVDFVLSQVRRFLAYDHRPGAIGQTLLDLFDTLRVSFPDVRAVTLANRILAIMNDLMKVNEGDLRDGFAPLCESLLLKIGDLVPSEHCRQFFSLMLTFLTETAGFFSFSKEHMEILLYRIRSLYPNGFSLDMSSELIFLIAGERLSTLTPTFLIRCDFAARLWLEVLENSEKWTESVLYLQQLCEFSVSNIVSCHHGEVDLYLIEKIRGGCHEDVLFRLLSSIAVHISSMPVVERFVSLFAPGDDKLQSIFGKVMKTLTTIVSMDMKEPQTLLPLVEESQVKMPYTLTVSTGFSFGCWFYLESASMKSFPLLLSTKTNDSKYFHVFVAGGVLQYSRAENPRAKSLTTVTKLPVREWCFICVTYRVHNQYSYIISRINNGEEEVIEKGTKKFPTGVVNMSFGGMIEGSNRTEAFSVLGPFGVFGVLSEEQVRNLWGKGPNRFEYEAPNPLFMYCPYNRYEYRTSSLSRVLVAQCKLPILFPLLLIENQSEHSSGTILDSLLDLITSMLITNPDVEAEFKREYTLSLLGHIIGTQSCGVKINYLLYGKFVAMLQHFQTDSVRAQMLKQIIMNLDLWTNSSMYDLILILKHWSRTLIPSFPVLIAEVHPFSRMLDEIMIYFSPRESIDDSDMAKCRQLMCQACQDLSVYHFSFEDFKLLISYICTCSDDKVVGNLSQVLLGISSLDPCPLKSCVGDIECVRLLLRFMKSPALCITGITVLVRLHVTQLLPRSDLGYNIHAMMSVADPSVFTYDLLDALLPMVNDVPELFALCCLCTIKLGDAGVQKVFSVVTPSKQLANDKFWAFWPIMMAVKTRLSTGMMSFLAFCEKDHFILPFCMLRTVECILGIDLSRFKHDFLMIIGEQMVSGAIDGQLIHTFSKLACSFIFFQEQPFGDNVSVMSLLQECYGSVDSPARITEEQEEQDFDLNGVFERILETDFEPKAYGFKLHVDADGKWLDADLGSLCLLLLHKFKAWEHFPFEAMLLYFLSDRRTELFVVNCLNEIDNSGQLPESAASYLRLLSSKLIAKGITHPLLTETSRDNMAAFEDFEKSLWQAIPSSYRKLGVEMKEDSRVKLERAKNLASDNLPPNFWMKYQKVTITDIELMNRTSCLKWQRIRYCLTLPHSPFASMMPHETTIVRCGQRNRWFCPARVKRRFGTDNQNVITHTARTGEEDTSSVVKLVCSVMTTNGPIASSLAVYPNQIQVKKQTFRSWDCEFPNIEAVVPIRVDGNDDVGLEIMTKTGKSKFMFFDNGDARKTAYERICACVQPVCCIYEKVESSVCDEWRSRKLSNFQFILYVNMCSNRTFSLPNQYPIFPKEAITGRAEFSTLRQTGIYQDIKDIDSIPEHFYLCELFAGEKSAEYVHRNRVELESDRISDMLPQWMKQQFDIDVEPRAPRTEKPEQPFQTDSELTDILLCSPTAPADSRFLLVDSTGTVLCYTLGMTEATVSERFVMKHFASEWTHLCALSNQHLAFQSQGHLHCLSLATSKVTQLPGHGEIHASGNGFFVVVRPSSTLELFHVSDLHSPVTSVPFFQHPVRCACVSPAFRVVAIGCESSCLIIPIGSSFSFTTIEFGSYKPIQVSITDSFGHIVTFAKAVKLGQEKHALFLHSINGTLISKHTLAFPVVSLCTWSDATLQDHIAYACDCHVFHSTTTTERLTFDSSISSLFYDRGTSRLVVVTSTAKIHTLPL